MNSSGDGLGSHSWLGAGDRSVKQRCAFVWTMDMFFCGDCEHLKGGLATSTGRCVFGSRGICGVGYSVWELLGDKQCSEELRWVSCCSSLFLCMFKLEP